MNCLPAQRVRQILGQELDLLVFDGHSGLDPDALAASCGCLRGGGLLLLLLPDPLAAAGRTDPYLQRISHRPEGFHSHFGQRLHRLLRQQPGFRWLAADVDLPRWQAPPLPAADQPLCLTLDQQQALEPLRRTALGRARRPLLLLADRGRGKSSLLGLAAAELLQQGLAQIRVTAPRVEMVETLFTQAEQALPQAKRQGWRLQTANASLGFMPPDELLRQSPPADLLLVDEAAAIPGPLLEALLARYTRMVLATTVHGYEGSGRGFALRFAQRLDHLAPNWHQCRLQQPVRWAVDDPLEAFLYQALLLDAEASASLSPGALASLSPGASASLSPGALASLSPGALASLSPGALASLSPGSAPSSVSALSPGASTPFNPDGRVAQQGGPPATHTQLPGRQGLSCRRVNGEQLSQDEALLRQIHGLLLAAHYQTRPSDLRRLLDDPELACWLLQGPQLDQGPLAVLLVLPEGGLDPELAAAVSRGERRLHGHLLPQGLALYSGLAEAARLSYWRIMRIAVQPEYQRQGLGSALVQHLIDACRQQGVDFIGVSFGATPQLLPFWYAAGFLPARLGVRRDAASGQHSLLMLQGLSPAGQALQGQLQGRFDEQLPYLLGDPLRQLEPEIAALLWHPASQLPALSAADWQDLQAFAQGQRDYAGARLALWRWTCRAAAQGLESVLLRPLILKVLQGRDWAEVAALLQLPGQRQVLQAMRQGVGVGLQLGAGG
jgi:tRNA(Met) cytidine acetyltransferase